MEDLEAADGRTVIEQNLRDSVGEDMDWIDLVQDRETWRALVNVVMNLRVT